MFAVACSDDPVSNHSNNVQHAPTLVDQEADEAALWLSGEMTSPPALYSTIQSDLAAIRADYAASVPNVSIKFRPKWESSKLIVGVDEDLNQKLLAHEPNALEAMNRTMSATEMERSFIFHPEFPFVSIHFEGRKHPWRLAEVYRSVEGVTSASPDRYVGDGPSVYPWPVSGGMSYLFRNGFGDCLAGCMYSDFYYFRRANGRTEYVGSYKLGVDPEPVWWTEAKTAYDVYDSGPDPVPAN
jgi:hypothetical protein